MTALSPVHKRWFLVEQVLIAALINVVLNAVIAWLLFRDTESVALWGEGGVGPDLLITGFLLPFAICLINSSLIPRQVEAGKVPALAQPLPAPGPIARAPRLVRAVALGATGVAVAAVPLTWLLGAIAPLSVESFVGIKGLWAGALAALVSPMVAWWALVRASHSREVT